ncbi:hypothetical protein CRENBAI_012386 [Crenichthys baileyi]|uniref:Uncharacterized protein n=1 Tax=Crenichthys baileyi TaxID=28760 RepID=A0AAV9RJU4_9TELE
MQTGRKSCPGREEARIVEVGQEDAGILETSVVVVKASQAAKSTYDEASRDMRRAVLQHSGDIRQAMLQHSGDMRWMKVALLDSTRGIQQSNKGSMNGVDVEILPSQILLEETFLGLPNPKLGTSPQRYTSSPPLQDRPPVQQQENQSSHLSSVCGHGSGAILPLRLGQHSSLPCSQPSLTPTLDLASPCCLPQPPEPLHSHHRPSSKAFSHPPQTSKARFRSFSRTLWLFGATSRPST